MDICVDFDGTCVAHNYPAIGKDIGAIPVLKRLCNEGHHLILFTMRSEEQLTDAVQWFENNEIPLHGVNRNPLQHHWTSSPKAYGQVYIDDAAVGTPLVHPTVGRPYVDWDIIECKLEDMRVLKRQSDRPNSRTYLYRAIESNPYTTNYGEWYEWQVCNKEKYDEINTYINQGYNYQTTIVYGSNIKKERKDVS